MKNPLVLAIIEFVTLGLGTVILGKRRGWGAAMLIGAGMLRYEELRIAPLASGVWNPHWVPMVLGLTIMGIVMAMDVFKQAKEA
jgi:uncharacterized protein (DUF2062 family)